MELAKMSEKIFEPKIQFIYESRGGRRGKRLE